ncbi:hypothetical protein AXG93_1618s1020 [Marchantia polymorpha subsp. ruderalis]|uniref:Uncharacterized protein n=1 Tax=Marchantia polymorpha subsp. ruderalis TaxID=1480154 RepID=A0A176VL96_MARPO|nr:hypothetical protein AXG93_1618s1020 [Marchantia polymorpha subsp. ruderalis]
MDAQIIVVRRNARITSKSWEIECDGFDIQSVAGQIGQTAEMKAGEAGWNVSDVSQTAMDKAIEDQTGNFLEQVAVGMLMIN